MSTQGIHLVACVKAVESRVIGWQAPCERQCAYFQTTAERMFGQ